MTYLDPAVETWTMLAPAALGSCVGYVIDRALARGWCRRPGEATVRPTLADLPRLPGMPGMPGAATATVGAVWLLIAARLPLPTSATTWLVWIAHLALAAVVVAASGVDARVRRLPDVFTLPAGVAVTTLAALALASGDASTSAAGGRSLIAGVTVPLLALVLTLTVGGLGLGDVKLLWPLSAALAWHGWTALLTGLAACWLLAGLTSAALLLTRRAGRHTSIPLGPFLAVGALTALLTLP